MKSHGKKLTILQGLLINISLPTLFKVVNNNVKAESGVTMMNHNVVVNCEQRRQQNIVQSGFYQLATSHNYLQCSMSLRLKL